jgi:hypothetical protein
VTPSQKLRCKVDQKPRSWIVYQFRKRRRSRLPTIVRYVRHQKRPGTEAPGLSLTSTGADHARRSSVDRYQYTTKRLAVL